MALTPGTRLGVYEVTTLLGAGGMGQVYRATDTKLKRQVAFKVLPPSVAADHDRLARFQREAEVPFPQLNDRLRGRRSGGDAFSVSSTGVLVYVGAAEDDSRLTWFDRKGKRLRTIGDPGNLGRMDLSPDEKTVAVVIFDGGNTDIATCDVARGWCERFTSNPAPDDSPVWSSDGDMIVFRSIRNGLIRLFRKRADGSGVEDEVLAGASNKWPNSLAPDGRLAYVITGAPKTSSDIWFLRLPLAGTGEPIPSVVLNSGHGAARAVLAGWKMARV